MLKAPTTSTFTIENLSGNYAKRAFKHDKITKMTVNIDGLTIFVYAGSAPKAGCPTGTTASPASGSPPMSSASSRRPASRYCIAFKLYCIIVLHCIALALYCVPGLGGLHLHRPHGVRVCSDVAAELPERGGRLLRDRVHREAAALRHVLRKQVTHTTLPLKDE